MAGLSAAIHMLRSFMTPQTSRCAPPPPPPCSAVQTPRPVLSFFCCQHGIPLAWRHGAAGLLVGVSEKIVAAACDVGCCCLIISVSTGAVRARADSYR
jgi:hypothetical protein